MSVMLERRSSVEHTRHYSCNALGRYLNVDLINLQAHLLTFSCTRATEDDGCPVEQHHHRVSSSAPQTNIDSHKVNTLLRFYYFC